MEVPNARNKRWIAAFGTALAIGIGLLFLSIPFLSGPLSHCVPASVEATVGSQMIEELSKDADFCQDPQGLEALDELVEMLVEGSNSSYEFRVYVADQEVLNAFAAPGGHIVLYRSIIEQAETPEEVAGVLAHEMAHITEGHPARGMVEAMGYGFFRLFTPGDNNMGAELVKSAVTNHYSREDELEADLAGVGRLNERGMDSTGLNAFFDRLSEQGQEIPGALEFLSTHPSGATRKAALEGYAQGGEPPMSDDDWQALRGICDVSGDAVYVGPG